MVEWEDVQLEIREFIQEHLRSGQPVFEGQIKNSGHTTSTEEAFTETAPQTDTEKRIIEILDEYVRPAVANDGGAIHFKAYKDGVVTVVLRGACSGCPSSMVTLKNGIEALMQQMIPEIKEVVAEEK